MNGKPALLYYVSATQINALTPLDTTLGPVSIVVTNNGLLSVAFTANLQTVTPAFLRFDVAGHITATHADGSFLGPTSLGSVFTPAAPGETIVTYAVGFGLPSTPSSWIAHPIWPIAGIAGLSDRWRSRNGQLCRAKWIRGLGSIEHDCSGQCSEWR